jgi:hypothetical protein
MYAATFLAKTLNPIVSAVFLCSVQMLHRLLWACEGLLSKYPTTLAQDEAAIAVKVRAISLQTLKP